MPKVKIFGVCVEQFTIQTITSPNNQDYNSPHISAIFITPRTPNNFNFLYFYCHPYFIIQQLILTNKLFRFLILWNDSDTF